MARTFAQPWSLVPRHPATSASSAGLSDRVFSDLLARARSQPGTVHPLHVGDSWLEPFAAARVEMRRVATTPRLHGYAPVQGEPALLDAFVADVERRTGLRLDREALQVTAGATAGVTHVVATLTEPGDEVVVLAPYWPLVRGIVQLRGARVVEVPFFDRLDAPDFDPERALAEALTDRTVALYLNSPNNPTGRVLPVDVVDRLLALAVRHDLWVIADEAYEELVYGARSAAPVWTRPGAAGRTLAVHTMSKGWAMAGARVGLVHGPIEPMRRLRGVQTFSVYCAPRPMQLGAAVALREGRGWLEAARALYAQAATMAASALGVPPPEGGTFLFFDATPHLRAGETLADWLARCVDAGVLLTPGGASGRGYENWARLCFTCVPPDQLADALERLRRVLAPCAASRGVTPT
ncbi:MAG: pyridoxal phosphate-dependent aminotransferase [Myxococcota bacterium]|nr:pyridoxal phosphate-dependent aminotransferase [Myxococcota bacterium]MDW8363550.1 pyridoxal phosphate-dependent aminotransferase [Myxococcales bacterium]